MESKTLRITKLKGELKDMSETKSIRRRVNISRGMKGAISWEATVDAEGYTKTELLLESDELVKALEQRYPAVVEKEKA